MKGSYLGTEYNQEEIEKELKAAGANFETLKYDELIDKLLIFYQMKKLLDGFKVEWNLDQEL
jgi:carbamoyltransferase